MQAARARGGIPDEGVPAGAAVVQASPEVVHAAAVAYATRHFSGYGYTAENVAAQGLGYDIEVSNAKARRFSGWWSKALPGACRAFG